MVKLTVAVDLTLVELIANEFGLEVRQSDKVLAAEYGYPLDSIIVSTPGSRLVIVAAKVEGMFSIVDEYSHLNGIPPRRLNEFRASSYTLSELSDLFNFMLK